jgi:hypothetical protein
MTTKKKRTRPAAAEPTAKTRKTKVAKADTAADRARPRRSRGALVCSGSGEVSEGRATGRASSQGGSESAGKRPAQELSLLSLSRC